jgi:hypothetical protein
MSRQKLYAGAGGRSFKLDAQDSLTRRQLLRYTSRTLPGAFESEGDSWEGGSDKRNMH